MNDGPFISRKKVLCVQPPLGPRRAQRMYRMGLGISYVLYLLEFNIKFKSNPLLCVLLTDFESRLKTAALRI